MIPAIPLVTTPVRQLDEDLWRLHQKCAEGTATPSELRELDRRIAVAEQDNEERKDG